MRVKHRASPCRVASADGLPPPVDATAFCPAGVVAPAGQSHFLLTRREIATTLYDFALTNVVCCAHQEALEAPRFATFCVSPFIGKQGGSASLLERVTRECV